MMRPSEFQDDPYIRHLQTEVTPIAQRVSELGRRGIDSFAERLDQGLATAAVVVNITTDLVGRALHR